MSAAPSGNVEPRHHGVVLVLQVVTVDEVPSAIVLEAHDHPHRLVRMHNDRILPARFVWRGWLAVSIEDEEIHQVHVNRVDHLKRHTRKWNVAEGPDFDGVE